MQIGLTPLFPNSPFIDFCGPAFTAVQNEKTSLIDYIFVTTQQHNNQRGSLESKKYRDRKNKKRTFCTFRFNFFQ